MISKKAALVLPALVGLSFLDHGQAQAKEESYDVVVYGGISGGVTAAVQAARMGRSVALIEPGKHLGGMTSGGLGFVDVGKTETIGGLACEYFHDVWSHYQQDSAWKREKKHSIKEQHAPLAPGDETMWIVEPSVAEQLFNKMAREAKVTVIRGEHLDRKSGVEKEGTRIVRIKMESGRSFRSKMFIDATYEGDLMAAAGVSYMIGREPNSRYHETLNGIWKRTDGVVLLKVDPYKTKGDPKSGLLPRIHPDLGGAAGEGDAGVQAYNFRMCLTDLAENRVPIEKPANYDEGDYELIFRVIEAGQPKEEFLKTDRLPNRKTDTNNCKFVSTDLVGMSWGYAEADYATRERIARQHEDWQRGLLWTLQNHPRVPEEYRKYFSPWGLAKDEFAGTDHWPFQLYIREARRMIGDVVVTENTALGKEIAPDPVGIGSYHMDSHAVKYWATPEGYLSSDGGMFANVPAPFGISYRAIVPKRGECENLLVPVCASATHAAYGSMRMEPVFMVLGQSAATAASLAIEQGVAVQDVPYEALSKRLLADKQILAWPNKAATD